MQLKTAIKEVAALSYMVSGLDLQSIPGRRYLLDSVFMTEAANIEKELQDVEDMLSFISRQDLDAVFEAIKRKLSQLRDISGTITRLSRQTILDDIELFELKHFLLLSEEITGLLVQSNIDVVSLPNIRLSLNILDPQNRRLPNFYIYDAYSKELAVLRKQLKEALQKLEKISSEHSELIKEQEGIVDSLYQQSVEEEDKIRTQLSGQLYNHWETILDALQAVSRLDVLMAKAGQVQKMDLTRPYPAEVVTVYKGIFNPQLKHLLESQGKEFQSVDITLQKCPCVITGANMSGKTVLLKTVQLAQYLFQFGFFVPATEATICVVDDILICMEDEQNALKGLSSFAAEMLAIDNMVKTISAGKNVLILIDELARTTNPIEGGAIVNGMLDFLNEHKAQSIITTHYSGIMAACKKLRVKGFLEGKVQGTLTKENIGDYIDYSLEEDADDNVPMEAFRVASILGIDNDLLERVKIYMNGD